MTTGKATNKTPTIPRHPSYLEYQGLWQQMRDTSEGEHKVKEGTTNYLPKTAGQKADKVSGEDAYLAYLNRAVWPDILKNTQVDSIGLLHRESPAISLPKSMMPYMDEATDRGEGIEALARLINENQLTEGRCLLLMDTREDWDTPRSILYAANRVVNWGDDGEWVILDESSYVLNAELKREWKRKYRLIKLDSRGEYYTITFENWDPSYLLDPEDAAYYPTYKGKRLAMLPVTFVNANTTTPDVELPPLLPLSNACLASYRGDADYRQTLFMQSFAILFLSGFTEDELGNITIGSGNYIHSSGEDAKADFVEVSGAGLSEMRESQDKLIESAHNLGIELKDQSRAESGKALSTRLAIRTASLEAVARTCGDAITKQMDVMASWMGVTEDYEYSPNLDFVEAESTPSEMLQMLQSWKEGGITDMDYYVWMRKNDFTSLTYEEFIDEIKQAGVVAGLEEKIQKIYLGVGKVITSDEARAILNDSGAELPIPGPEMTEPQAGSFGG